ncbi:MAG: acyl-CoA dehydrogenase [Pseudomonadota bacterium]
MQSTILSRRDIDFMLYRWLDVARLTARPRFAEHSRETFDAAIDTAEQIATELFAPHNKKNDQQEPHAQQGERALEVHLMPEVKAALGAVAAAGLMAAGQDEALGGMQLPCVVEKVLSAYFSGANIGTASYLFLTVGNANTILKYGTARQIERFVRPMLEGKFFGTMCLSEPQAGSSLSDIRTRAVPDPVPGPDGERQYRLSGNKMWISGGEHDAGGNIVHLVLAKIAAPDGATIAGVKGISLFIVPKYVLDGNGAPGQRNDVVLAGLNHKMGQRGTTNCLLNFGEGRFEPDGKPGAIGYLVGQPHQGLANMFHMMNEARIAVGLGAAVLGYTAYLHALDYARHRPQGRDPAAKDPATPQIAIICHTDVRRMLLAQKAYVEGGLALALYSARLVDEAATAPDPAARAQALRLLDFLTPITKSWPSQWCLEANNLAIQVHGGYGYTRDYNVEQFYRDNRLNAIHEGTHGIHGLDLLGRKASLQDGALLRAFGQALGQTVAEVLAANAIDPRLVRYAGQLAALWERIELVTASLHASGDLNLTLANATVYLEALGHTAVAWLWLQQGLAAGQALAGAPEQGDDADFYRGKLQACQYFFQWELPKVGRQLDLLHSLDSTALAMQDAWF